MKNNIKRLLAMILAVSMLFSVAACSKMSESNVAEEKNGNGFVTTNIEADSQTEENSDEFVTGNIESDSQAEAIREEIRQKAAEIIATLEVGKAYDELPITAKKLGVQRYSATTFFDAESEGPHSVYIDAQKGQACIMPDDFLYILPLWLIGDFETDTVEKIYCQHDKTVSLCSDKREDFENSDYDCFSFYYGCSGYDLLFDAHSERNVFIYLGEEYLDGYGTTLAFEVDDGYDHNYGKYNIDPETGFWVRYYDRQITDYGIDEEELFIKDIVIEPDFYVPDFENDLVEYSNGFATKEEAVNAWVEAFYNKDLDTIAAMIPQSEKMLAWFNGGELTSTTRSMLSVEVNWRLSEFYLYNLHSEKDDVISEESVSLSFVEEMSAPEETIAEIGDSSIQDLLIRKYVVNGTDEEITIELALVNEDGYGWSAFTFM